MTTQRIAGLTIAAAGIAFSVLTTTGLLVVTCAALVVLLFSRAVPRWWSLAYPLFALALLAVIIWLEGEAAMELAGRLQRDRDVLFTTWEPRFADYVVIGLRLVLGVVASLAIAAPLVLPAGPSRRVPDAPRRPLGL